VKSTWGREPQLIWSFWAAAAFVAVGGALPFLVGGSSSRVATVFIPFAVAALAFAACALVHEQGRAITSGLYLLAGFGIVYGLLTLFALPLQLAVLGTCPVPPQTCVGGLQHPLTVAENTGIGLGAAFGILALFIGFFGLVVVYRRAASSMAPPAPPTRTIPPVAPRQAKPAPVAGAATAAPVAEPAEADHTPEAFEAESEPAAETRAELPELTEAEPELELPAHEDPELPELPPHESTSPAT
jgi:hypothetical protein